MTNQFGAGAIGNSIVGNADRFIGKSGVHPSEVLFWLLPKLNRN